MSGGGKSVPVFVRRHLTFRSGSTVALFAVVLLATGLVHPQDNPDKIRGLPNFHAVNGHIYRGGQPSGEGLEKLKGKGIEIVIDFRNRGKSAERERQMVESLGMQYVSLPWTARRFPPPEVVQRFFEIVDGNQDKKLFVHCRRGADRTGYMIGLYRVTREGWTAKQAAEEMESYGFHGLWYGHLKKNLFKLEAQGPASVAQPQ
jgi:protein tyrosine/serine phosphatase